MDTYRIVLADHHILFRQELAKILTGREDLEIVGEAGDGLDLLNLLERLALNHLLPHLIVLDLSMPDLPGMAAARWISLAYPGAKVLILTMHNNRELVSRALSHGAKGYLLKDDIETELSPAINVIRHGEVYVPAFFSNPAHESYKETSIKLEGRPMEKIDAKIILLVDDDDRFLTVLANEIRESNNSFNVLTAENGEKALKILESKHVDLVVTDLKMPVMNGFQLVSHMKESYPGIPVIVMSFFLNSRIEAALRAEGVSQCIAKSNISDLVKVIDTLPLSPSAPSGTEVG